MTEDGLNAEKAPLMSHLIELRRRLMLAAGAYLVCVCIAYFFAEQMYGFLVRPLAETVPDPSHRRLIYTSLTEAFFTYLKLAMFGGFFLAFPIIAAQAYRFVAPGLYRSEKRAVLPCLIAAPVLFLAGAGLCYYQIMPLAWKFFLSFETPSAGGLPIQLEARVGEYLSLVMHMVLAFGVSFQLPLVLIMLVQAGIIEAAALKRSRRYAVVGIAGLSAVVTPPDIFSMVALMLPLYALYEGSILLCGRMARRREGERPPV